jgi:hypothetical protein
MVVAESVANRNLEHRREELGYSSDACVRLFADSTLALKIPVVFAVAQLHKRETHPNLP